MKKILLTLSIILNFWVVGFQAQTNVSETDKTAIKQTSLDYIEGFYEGNAERMERALHPEMAKRIVKSGSEDGKDNLNNMDAPKLIQMTRSGAGKSIPKAKQTKEVVILDVFGRSASVKIDAGRWVDYLHLSKFNGRWVIINVLWELKPQKP